MIPLAYIITPNIPEAEEITGIKIHNVDDMKRVGEEILQLGPKFVLMKGGHLDGEAVDILVGKIYLKFIKVKELIKKYTWNRVHIIFCNNILSSIRI